MVPGAAGFAAGAIRNGVPSLLTVILVLLAAAAAVTAAPFTRRTAFPFLQRSVIGRFKR